MKEGQVGVRRVHFVIEGEWFTNLLRQMWVEGSEAKAIRVWEAAFPKQATPVALRDTFLRLVSGKAKFTGTSDSPGLQMEPDDCRFYQGDESLPLLNSWEDVILLKKTRLYVAELDLRRFRYGRRFMDQPDEPINVFEWAKAVDENRLENNLRRVVNGYLTDIQNLCVGFGADLKLDMLPTEEIPLLTGPTALRRRDEYATYLQCKRAYSVVRSQLEPIDRYFKAKYGEAICTFNWQDVKDACGIPVRYEEQLDKAVDAAREDMAGEPEKINPSVMVPILDVNKYIRDAIREGDREVIEPEDVMTTVWTSGYIDRKGQFYGCSDLGHVAFADNLCEKLGLEVEGTTNSSEIIDRLGWVKVSMGRFFWDTAKRPSKAQERTMMDYMLAKGMKTAIFNVFGKPQTLMEALEDGQL
ncbi:MAG: hypothetical protein WC291_09495 [Thermodesulfovibrionales bacterium]|jgi:hypothetical protein